MGRPNFMRLAELGQLPDYIKPEELALVEVDQAVKKFEKVEVKEEVKLEDLKQKELIVMCEENGLPNYGKKAELIERLEEFFNKEVPRKKEDSLEFVDDIIK